MLSVLLSSDYPLLRAGLRTTLARAENLVLLDQESNSHNLHQLCRELTPDVLLFNPSLLDVALSQFITYLRDECQPIHLLLLLDPRFTSTANFSSILIHRKSVVLLDEPLDILVAAILAVGQGNLWFSQAIVQKFQLPAITCANLLQAPYLTKREREILQLVAQGVSNKEVARSLLVSENTVEFHMKNILRKFGVPSRLAAVAWARERNLFAEN